MTTRGGGGGLITLVHHEIPFTNTTSQTRSSIPHDPTQTLEMQTSRLTIHKQNINLANIYIPPISSTPNSFSLHLDHFNTQPNSYLLGDFNAHDPAWLSNLPSSPRGYIITQQLPNLTILNNPGTLTRRPYNINTQAMSPDISFVSPEFSTRSAWEALHELPSDHLPILIKHTLHRPYVPPSRRTFTNYNKANWTAFTNSIEHDLLGLDMFNTPITNIDTITNRFNSIISHNSKLYIPTGAVKHYSPGFNRSIRPH